MNDTPTTDDEIALLRRGHAAALEFRDDLSPLLIDYLAHGHTRHLIIHYLMFTAYTLADELYPAHDLNAESVNRENATNLLRVQLDTIIQYCQDFPTPPPHAADPDITH